MTALDLGVESAPTMSNGASGEPSTSQHRGIL